MSSTELAEAFITGLKATTALEYIAVITGIASVWFSRAENILVYPVGLISTTIYIWLFLKAHLFGEASVNIYYSIMGIWGWWLWTRKSSGRSAQLRISFSTRGEWLQQLLFFSLFYIVLFGALSFLRKAFAPDAMPWADAFASATAFTGMWLMARKKVESWWWWIATDIVSVPLCFAKGYVFTSFQFVVFTVLAVMGLISWWRKAAVKHLVS